LLLYKLKLKNCRMVRISILRRGSRAGKTRHSDIKLKFKDDLEPDAAADESRSPGVVKFRPEVDEGPSL
jgi:hypothetical protein